MFSNSRVATWADSKTPEMARDYCIRGQFRLSEGDYQGAIQDFRTAIMRDWENGFYKHCLMHGRAKNHDLAGAIKDCQWMLAFLESQPDCRARNTVQAKVRLMLEYFQTQEKNIPDICWP